MPEIFWSSQVYGSGFVDRDGLLLCRFGDDHVVEATFASSSVVRCTAPAQTEPGAIEIAVSVDGGATFGGNGPSDSGLAASVHFRYLAPSFVTDISPRSGPDTGGTVVSVLGMGFSSAFRFVCKFQSEEIATEAEGDSAAATVEILAAFISPSELACIAPPVVFGDQLGHGVEVAIFAIFESGILTRLPTSTASASDSPTYFTYVPSLQLRALNPDRGPAAGGTIVDITGANFFPPATSGDVDASAATEAVWCRFGSTVTVGFPLSDGLVRCSTPPQSIGESAEVEVSVSVNSGADFQGGPSGSLLVRGSEATVMFLSIDEASFCVVSLPFIRGNLYLSHTAGKGVFGLEISLQCPQSSLTSTF